MSSKNAKAIQIIRELKPADVAQLVEMPEADVWAWSENNATHFNKPFMRKVGSKERRLDVPKRPQSMKRYKRLHRGLQSLGIFHGAAHGGIIGRSTFSSATEHIGAQYVWTRDASNCFPSIGAELFKSCLRELGMRSSTARLLTGLLTVRDLIPQGSPPSNDALNLVFWRSDQRLATYCHRHKLSYGRVADDFVVAGANRAAGDHAAAKIEAYLEELGLVVNEKKKRESGFTEFPDVRLVHSIDVSNCHGTSLSPKHSDRAMWVGKQLVAVCTALQPHSLPRAAKLRRELHGWRFYSQQSTFGPTRQLRSQSAQADELVKKRLIAAGVSCRGWKWWVPGVAELLQSRWEQRTLVECC